LEEGMKHPFCGVVLLLGFAVYAHAQVVTDMTPELVQEAITQGGSGRYKIQEQTIWGDGPVLGYFTTPYSRVALAAALARKHGKPYTPAEVTPDMLRPELHVYARAQAVYGNKNRIANVTKVVVMPYQSRDPSAAIHPTRTEDVADEYWNLMGAVANGRNVMAVFPLSVLSENNEIRVVYDRHVPGSSQIKGCTDCGVRFSLAKVR
jgi:hypothetical protein